MWSIFELSMYPIIFAAAPTSLIVVWSIMFAVSLAILVFGVIYIFKGLVMRKWRKTEGRITKSKVETYISDSSESGSTLMYTAKVEYFYTVGQTSYDGDVVRMAQADYSWEDNAAKIVEKYYRSRVVPVFYNPDDPSKAVLNRKPSNWVYGPFLLGLGMTAITGGLMWTIWTGQMH